MNFLKSIKTMATSDATKLLTTRKQSESIHLLPIQHNTVMSTVKIPYIYQTYLMQPALHCIFFLISINYK